jgi:hypothetical protein
VPLRATRSYVSRLESQSRLPLQVFCPLRARLYIVEFEINEDTIIVINGDRAKWIRMFREWFCDCTVLYQVDRFHLLRTLGGIFKRGSESYYRLRDAMDKDPTGARFMAALAEESKSLSGKRQEDAEKLLRDLEGIADSVCDYRVRLKAEGYDIEGLRSMGAAEAQMDRFADRIKGRGQSWSPRGLDAMMRLLGLKFEGRLEELLHNLVVKQEPLPGEKDLVKKQAPQVAKTLIQQYGDIWSHSMPEKICDFFCIHYFRLICIQLSSTREGKPKCCVDVGPFMPYNTGKGMTSLQHGLWMEELRWNANIKPRLPARGKSPSLWACEGALDSIQAMC